MMKSVGLGRSCILAHKPSKLPEYVVFLINHFFTYVEFYFDKELGILLFDLIHGLKMQGIEVVITGIAPNMAKTITELSLDFSNLKLYGNLKQALSR
ncbi:hypothetical protein [Fictibacillus fluitans]|uniref:STAS domain-containing protein n=1 Tax=Fictibacillus fluitans TaxID=3058422 RepID=A0ABT8HRB5_9BACL|nr:hypothetical protein [Fictibacillus sp. NE201]MDN4523318.1 hypothetical protein [Fictibacillus sp. NE201]